MPPSQWAPVASWILQFQSSRLSSTYLPSYTSPLPKTYFPWPCFLPLSKWPSQSSPESSLSLPYPWNSPQLKSPSQSRAGLPPQICWRWPRPWQIPSRNCPEQMSPSVDLTSPLPSSLSFLKQPSQRVPSLPMQTPFPVFCPFSTAPSQLDPSLKLILPWIKRLSLKSPVCLYFLVISLPLPWYLRSFMLPSQVSPFFLLRMAQVQSPSSKVPLRVSPLAQLILPWPSSLPWELTEPSQKLPSKYLILVALGPMITLIYQLQLRYYSTGKYSFFPNWKPRG